MYNNFVNFHYMISKNKINIKCNVTEIVSVRYFYDHSSSAIMANMHE